MAHLSLIGASVTHPPAFYFGRPALIWAFLPPPEYQQHFSPPITAPNKKDVLNEMGIADSIKGVNNAGPNTHTAFYIICRLMAAPNIPPHKGPPAAFCHFTGAIVVEMSSGIFFNTLINHYDATHTLSETHQIALFYLTTRTIYFGLFKCKV